MRITGGTLGGRRILVPKTDIRPTQDRVRAAIFSSLADRVGGSSVLDLFAGSGSAGLEAFSRGAALVCWVESDPRAMTTLRANVELLCRRGHTQDQSTRLVRDDALRFLQRSARSDQDPRDRRPTTDSFDIIFADPPYDTDGAWLAKLLSLLACGQTLGADGVFIMEQRASAPIPSQDGWIITRDRRYGDSRVLFFRREKANDL